MSESIQVGVLGDIKDVYWFFEDGGRVKRKDGTYTGVDFYPKYFYDAINNLPAYINNRQIKWIQFRMISPRTRTHQDKIGMIQITYKYINYQNNTTFTTWCDSISIDEWLEQNITSGGLYLRSIPPIGIPPSRLAIQKLNKQQRQEELDKAFDDYYNDPSNFESNFNDYEYNDYNDYTWEDMIDDAFEGDESNYWNID